MVNRVRALLVFVLVVMMVAIGVVPAAAATTWYVDDGCGATQDGSASNPFCTITAAINAAAAGDTILVVDGTYNEAIVINKNSIQLKSVNGYQSTSIIGPTTASQTVLISGSGITFEGFTVKRDGNTVSDWIGNKNGTGISIMGGSNNTVQKNLITENRNGMALNTTSSNQILNNIITNNRTGINVFPNVKDCVVKNNFITDNWTFGVIFLFATSTSTGNKFNENNISGNWYAQVEDQESTGASRFLDFSANWLGSESITVDNQDTVHPQYDCQIPKAFGGDAEKPSTSRIIGGIHAAYVDYSPWLVSGTDTDSNAMGFQGDFSKLRVNQTSPQATSGLNPIQESINYIKINGEINVFPGTYNGNIVINKEGVTLKGNNAGINAANGASRLAETVINGGVEFQANNIKFDGFTISGGGVLSGSQPAGIYINASESGHVIANNIFAGSGKAAGYPGIMFGYATSNVTVSGNWIKDWLQGIYINPPANPGNLNFTGNKIEGCAAGIGSDGLNNVNITGNTFTGNDEGFGSSAVGNNVKVYHNKFVSNGAGVNWYSGNAINAIENWWRSDTGPEHSSNYIGGGDKVSDNVTFSPWSNEDFSVKYYLAGELQVTAPTGPIYIGDSFDVIVKANGVDDLAGFTMNLVYDGATLELVGAPKASTAVNSFAWGNMAPGNTASAGYIKWGVTLPNGGSPVDGDSELMVLTFKALKTAASGTIVRINDQLLSNINGDVIVPSNVVEASVVISPLYKVSGVVRLQGRHAGPQYSGSIVSLAALTYGPTAANGAYLFEVKPGTFAMKMQHGGYLATAGSATVIDTDVTVADQMLLFGDMNGDAKVNIQDLAYIAYRFGSTNTSANWSAVADMNLSNKVDIYDLSAAAGNYTKTSSPWL